MTEELEKFDTSIPNMKTTLIKVPEGVDASMPRKKLTLMELPNELLIISSHTFLAAAP